jgi:hypothetical protein
MANGKWQMEEQNSAAAAAAAAAALFPFSIFHFPFSIDS